MENFRRYDKYDESRYNRKGLSYLLMRKKADEIVIPYLKNIKNKKILEVGVGYGYYKDAYFLDNDVTGYDVNPEMGKNLGIEIISGKADEVGKIEEQYDYVLSFYMTEYLCLEELRRFIDDSVDILLKDGGVFASTIIVKRGMGRLYTSLATMKGIKKYSYSYEDIKSMVIGRNYNIEPLNTYLGIPMTVLLEIRK